MPLSFQAEGALIWQDGVACHGSAIVEPEPVDAMEADGVAVNVNQLCPTHAYRSRGRHCRHRSEAVSTC